MTEIWIHVIRTIMIYFIVFLVIRLMGKREIGKLSVFDLVISVMVAEIAVIVIEDTKRLFIDGITPMAVLLIVQVGLAMITLKSRKLRLWFDGKPTMMIERGQLNREAMRKQRYNLDDLMQQLRENQVSSLNDVEFAILETTGKLSVIKKEDDLQAVDDESSAEEPSSDELAAARNRLAKPFPKGFRFESLPIPLITDGKLIADNLSQIGKDRFWLRQQLKEKGAADEKQVFLCTIDHRGKIYVDIMNKGMYRRP